MVGRRIMTLLILFFTDKPVDELVTVTSTILEGDTYAEYQYKTMPLYRLSKQVPEMIPDLVQYGMYPGFSLHIFDLAKEYLSKVGDTFIIIKVCMGYPTPSQTLMPETTIDLKDLISGMWPSSLLDTFPDEKMEKDYRLEKGAEEFIGSTPSKKAPSLEWFVKYRFIDTGTQ